MARHVASAVLGPSRATPLSGPEFLALFGDAAIISWVVRLRWIVLGILLVLGLLLALIGALTWAMYLATGALAVVVVAYNLLFLVLLHLSPLWESPRLLAALRRAQLPPDLLVFTLAIHITGGATTPLPLFYAFFLVTALALMPHYGAYLAAALTTGCYSALVILEGTILPPALNPDVVAGAIYPAQAALVLAWHLFTVLSLLWLVAYGAERLAQRIQAGEVLIQHQLTDMGLLYRFSDKLSSSLNLDQATQYIVTELAALLDAHSCSLMLVNDQGEAEFRAATGLTSEALAEYRRHPLSVGNPLLGALLSAGNGIFAPVVDAVPGLRQILLRSDTRSFYSFLLRAEDKTVGFINLSFLVPYNMPPSTYDLIATCSRQAGLAIERSLLYQDAQRAAREMTSLYSIGLATSSSLEIDRVMRQIADQVQRVMAPDSFVLALYDEAAAALDFVLIRDRDVELPREPPLPLAQAGAGGWIVQHREPLLIRHWDREVPTLSFMPSTAGDQTQSYVGVPLVAANRVIGVISVQKLPPYAYQENDLRLLSAIAAQAALALENARLHDAARQQALRDSLTGAYNHAALIERIDQACDLARAESGQVALIMLDIDLFKQYNDSYGHVAGDHGLRSVVQAVTQHVKSTDSVGRWGGEEFGVLLPGASRAQALAVARRIRSTLATLAIPGYEGCTLPLPTISQGIAGYPADSQTSPQLVDHADGALYQAKARGRDTIVVWGESPDHFVPADQP